MTRFIAIKINYDNRYDNHPPLWWKRYTSLPSPEQYKEFVDRYNNDHVGGHGFHECLNFYKDKGNPVQIYLPPTCFPAAHLHNEDLVIFSFTYKSDPYESASIVGVHAQTRIVSDRDGTKRGAHQQFSTNKRNRNPFTFHAESCADLSTLMILPRSPGHPVKRINS